MHVVDQGKINQLTSLVEESIENECSPTEFIGTAEFKLGLCMHACRLDLDKGTVKQDLAGSLIVCSKADAVIHYFKLY